MGERLNIETRLRRLGGHRFEVEFEDPKCPRLIVDEPEPLGRGAGPNPVRLLSAAVGECLGSSLVRCLEKARVEAEDLKTVVRMELVKEEKGYWRISNIRAELFLKVADSDRRRVPRCLELFQDYCTVTQCVRQGTRVDVDVRLR